MEKPALRFQRGKFKIMQISDIQDAADISKETLRLIEAALDREQPDLAVLTGDQVKGYSPRLRGARNAANVEKTIRQIAAPFEARGVPFTFVFGNHDIQGGVALNAQEQLKRYQASPMCLAEDTPGVSGCGNHNLIVAGADGSAKLNIYLLDSHGNEKGEAGGYQPLLPDQVDWYRAARERLKAQAGDYVPSLLFQHIPVEDTYRVLKPVKKGTKGAVRGYRHRKAEYFALDESRAYPGSRVRESLCIPNKDAGLFAAAAEQGEMLGMYFGHDHKNSFAGRVDGIDLGYCPGCGHATYGDGVRRGVRVFEIDEANPHAYQTRLITEQELLGVRHVSFSTWLQDQAPTSGQDAIQKGIKLLIGLAVIAGLVALLAKVL